MVFLWKLTTEQPLAFDTSNIIINIIVLQKGMMAYLVFLKQA